MRKDITTGQLQTAPIGGSTVDLIEEKTTTPGRWKSINDPGFEEAFNSAVNTWLLNPRDLDANHLSALGCIHKQFEEAASVERDAGNSLDTSFEAVRRRNEKGKSGDMGVWLMRELVTYKAQAKYFRMRLEQRVKALEESVARKLEFAAVYDRSKIYKRGDCVIQHGTTFVAVVDVTADDPAKNSSADWMVFAPRTRREGHSR